MATESGTVDADDDHFFKETQLVNVPLTISSTVFAGGCHKAVCIAKQSLSELQVYAEEATVNIALSCARLTRAKEAKRHFSAECKAMHRSTSEDESCTQAVRNTYGNYLFKKSN